MSTPDDDRFARARTAFFARHDADPHGQARHYHETLARWVDRLEPGAPLPVRLAALGQHLERWTVPRSDYPEGRTGYRTWRSGLARMHAEKSGDIVRGAGYDDATAHRVGELLTKKRLKSDAEVALLEDAVCLTFLELGLAEFAEGRDPDQVVSILQKTWDKMTSRGHAAAQALAPSLPESAQRLLARALGSA